MRCESDAVPTVLCHIESRVHKAVWVSAERRLISRNLSSNLNAMLSPATAVIANPTAL